MNSVPSRLKFIKELQQPVRSKLKGYQKQPPPKRWNIVRGDTVQVINRRYVSRVFSMIRTHITEAFSIYLHFVFCVVSILLCQPFFA